MNMAGYTKLFSSIITSTIWREPNHVRIVWITMLALSDKNGEVQGSIPGLADMARVSIELCEDALERLESPDTYSRTKDYEGKRIRTIDGGWCILNHPKYRDLMSIEERKEYNRIKKAEQRAREAESKKCQTLSKSSMTVNDKSALSAHTDTEANAEADTKGRKQKAKALTPALKATGKNTSISLPP